VERRKVHASVLLRTELTVNVGDTLVVGGAVRIG
jgi:hypothetical protein